MIRVVVQTIGVVDAVHVGGPVHTSLHTFDVELPEIEAFLSEPERMNDHYTHRQIVGFEIRPSKE